MTHEELLRHIENALIVASDLDDIEIDKSIDNVTTIYFLDEDEQKWSLQVEPCK